MASMTSNPIPFITSSPDDNFIPRKEFVSSSVRQFSSFALLSFSSNNVIRLTNFDHNVFNELKARLHSVIGLRAFRENDEHTLGEIILLDKPWSNARFLSTEIVLVQVFAIMLRYDYSFVSQIDYGRETNDRVTLVFSRPNARTAVYPEGNQFPSQSGVTSFGLSFTSATSLRVVCSPLTGTPAILQSIRGSWPKGVKSEKKLGEQCYEFKLKGYSWFQEDTFSEDAPRHILTILSSLDKHSWSLITSLSLSSGRSRTKDFWIFASHPEAPPPNEHIQSVSLVNLGTPLKRDQFEPIEDGFNGSEGSNTAAHSTEDLTVPEPRVNELSHYKSSSSLNHSSLDRNLKPSNHSGHLRASSDVTGLNISREPGYLKPQVHQQPPLAAPVPIHIANTASFLIDSPSEPTPSTGRQPPTHSLISLPKDAEDEPHPRTDPDPNRTVDLAPTTGDHGHDVRSPSRIDDPPVLPFSPLLVPNAFGTPSGIEDIRSSVASRSSGRSFEVPITWVPRDTNGDKNGQLVNPFTDYDPKKNPPSAFSNPTTHSVSMSTETSDVNDPVLPGGWVNTPPTDVIQDPLQTKQDSGHTNSLNPLNETLQRNPNLLKEPTANSITSSSPQIIQPASHGANRPGYEPTRQKSEFAIVRTVPQQDVPPVPSRPDSPAEDVSEGKDTGSWVVVSRRSIFPNNEPSTPITAVDSNDSKEDLQQPEHGTGSKPGTLTSSGAVHFVNQTAPVRESPKGNSPRKRRPSIISRLLPSRKEDNDEQSSVASGDEKKSRQKPKKLLHGRSRT